jgi:hypothetical protein
MDKLAPLQTVTRPAAQQRPLPDAEIAFGGDVSWCFFKNAASNVDNSTLTLRRPGLNHPAFSTS